MDKFQHFLDDCCEMNSECYEAAGALYLAYHQWSSANGLRAVSETKFGIKMGQKGFQKSRIRTHKNNPKQSTVYHGINLICGDFDN